MTQDQENITKAFQCSDLLVSDIKQIYTNSEDELLQIVAFELLTDQIKINKRLEQIKKAICK